MDNWRTRLCRNLRESRLLRIDLFDPIYSDGSDCRFGCAPANATYFCWASNCSQCAWCRWLCSPRSTWILKSSPRSRRSGYCGFKSWRVALRERAISSRAFLGSAGSACYVSWSLSRGALTSTFRLCHEIPSTLLQTTLGHSAWCGITAMSSCKHPDPSNIECSDTHIILNPPFAAYHIEIGYLL